MYPTGTHLLDPHRIARAAGVRSGHTVVDLLCGHQGHCTFPAAALAGPDGLVHAVDMRRSAVDSVQARAQRLFEGNIEAHHANIEMVGGIPLADATADVVFLVNTLSLAANPLEVVREAVRLLKSGGSLAVVDWEPYGNTRIGPPVERRQTQQQVRSMCLVSGLDHEGAFEPGHKHWGFVCRKKVQAA